MTTRSRTHRSILPALTLLGLTAAAAFVPAFATSATPKRGTPRQQQCQPQAEPADETIGAPPQEEDAPEGWLRIDVAGPSWTY